MRYTDVDFVIKLRNLPEVAIWDKTALFVKEPKIVECKILANYVYVDTDERELFALNKHEYLIYNITEN